MKKRSRTDNTNLPSAIVDMAKSLSGVFKKYSRQTRGKAWKRLSSARGDKEMEKLAKNPKIPLSNFKKLQFKEWLMEENKPEKKCQCGQTIRQSEPNGLCAKCRVALAMSSMKKD